MTLFDLRIVDPATPDEDGEYIVGWSNLEMAVDRKQPADCNFDYPTAGAQRDSLRAKQLIKFLQDGGEGESCRFVLRSDETTGRIVDGVQMDSYHFKTIWDALRDATYQSPGTTKTRTWSNFTPGYQLIEVMKAPAARGAFDWWGYQGLTFTAAEDSAGNPWPKIDEMEHEYGVTIYDIWDWLVENAWIEVSSTGGYLNAYVPDTHGDDLTTLNPPVMLQQGRELLDAPQQRTLDDYVTDLYVIGGETEDPNDNTKTRPKVFVNVSSGITTYGRREKTLKVTGVQSVATLTKIGRQYLTAYRDPRWSRTYAVAATDPEDLQVVKVTKPAPGVWTPWLTLSASDQTLQYQNVVANPLDSNELYGDQSNDNTGAMYWTRIVGGVEVGKMTLPNGGHGGGPVYVFVDSGEPRLVFRYGQRTLDDYVWVAIPFVNGKTWTDAQALAYACPAPARPSSAVPNGYWMQGETFLSRTNKPVAGGKFYRFWGSPVNKKGPTKKPHTPARVDIIEGNKVKQKLDLTKLALAPNGIPFGDRLEPEGITTVWMDGSPYLAAGFAIGYSGSITHKLYLYPLEPAEQKMITEVHSQPIPMIDFTAGDYIGIGLNDGQPARRERVEIISATCDSNDTGSYRVTVNDWLDNRETKITRVLDKYGSGT